jgi:hypothetical protein
MTSLEIEDEFVSLGMDFVPQLNLYYLVFVRSTFVLY